MTGQTERWTDVLHYDSGNLTPRPDSAYAVCNYWPSALVEIIMRNPWHMAKYAARNYERRKILPKSDVYDLADRDT